MSKLSEADDRFHAPATPDPWWTETCWFSFDLPERDLSLTVYPFFRPNLGICSLAVYLWDASAHEPWAVRYARSYWHLPMPRSDLVDLDLEGLRYERLEPLRRYRVTYEDADVLAFELDLAPLFRRDVRRAGLLSRFPSVRRDLAFVVAESTPWAALSDSVRQAAGPSLRDLVLFDRYVGKGVETGFKSLAMGLILQEESRTLTDRDVDSVVAQVMAALERDHGAAIRS